MSMITLIVAPMEKENKKTTTQKQHYVSVCHTMMRRNWIPLPKSLMKLFHSSLLTPRVLWWMTGHQLDSTLWSQPSVLSSLLSFHLPHCPLSLSMHILWEPASKGLVGLHITLICVLVGTTLVALYGHIQIQVDFGCSDPILVFSDSIFIFLPGPLLLLLPLECFLFIYV